MKQLFTPGQEVVCIEDSFEMRDQTTWQIVHGTVPIKNETYTVENAYAYKGIYSIGITLKEFPSTDIFDQRSFAPVLPSDQLEKEIIEIFQPITII